MRPFQSVAMVDWSSGNDTGARPRKDAIWAGAVLGGEEIEPVYLRNRVAAFDWLERLIRGEAGRGRRLMIGFDFPFGYPAGFSRTIVGDGKPLKLWQFFAAHLKDTPNANSRFDLAGELNSFFPGTGPFWFNALKRDIEHLPRKGRAREGHGQKERRAVEERARGAFTCWQMGGVGAVGGQAMTGMAVLGKLRARFPDRIAVWPFEPLDRPVAFVEIWPSLIRDVVAGAGDPIRDRAQVRLIARGLAGLPTGALERMLDVEAPEEGWILGLGHEGLLADAACRS